MKSFAKKVKVAASRLCAYLLHCSSKNVDAAHNLLKRNETLYMMLYAGSWGAVISTPIVGVWWVFILLLGIPIDWVRALAIWILILLLSAGASFTDEVRKQRGF